MCVSNAGWSSWPARKVVQMAQPIPCDFCDEEPMAMLLVTTIENGDTIGIGARCFVPWCQTSLEAFVAAQPAAVADAGVTARKPRGRKPVAEQVLPPSNGDEAGEPAAFPNTTHVVKSTHGHRKARETPQELTEPPEASSVSS